MKNIQWYPGHMTKARREMEASLRLIDMVIEVVDARVPSASRNPDIDRMGQNKYRMILLNKEDLADEDATKAWEEWFKGRGISVVRMDARKPNAMKAVKLAVTEVCREKIERDRRRGILNRPVRAMVAGIPNVGKSTFINSFAGKASTKTGNKPGVTRGNQWIRLNSQVELLDTPGILWPKFEDQEVGIRLALVGTINDEVLPVPELAAQGILRLRASYPGRIGGRFPGVEEDGELYEILQQIALCRHCLKKGGEPDTEKAAALFLDDLRSGKLGRVTLELPPEE